MSLRACVLYHMHGEQFRDIHSIAFVTDAIIRDHRSVPSDFAQAQNQFKKILAIDPYRIDDIDVYSNILYVTENQIQLSKLVLTFLGIDKDRPELCCLIGEVHYHVTVSWRSRPVALPRRKCSSGSSKCRKLLLAPS